MKKARIWSCVNLGLDLYFWFQIRKNETKGRYLTASRDIKNSEVLFKEDPLIIGPKTVSPDPVCLGCLKPIISLSSSPKCPKCRWPVCDIQCSELQNGPHNLECAVLAAENRKERKKYKLVMKSSSKIF